MRLKRSIGLLMATIAATLATVLVAGQPAFASNPGTINNLISWMCLQPLPGPFQTIYDNGVRIAQMPCNGSTEQQWSAVQLGTGKDPLKQCGWTGCVYTPESYNYIINRLTNLCLDVTDARTDDRAEIQQYNCNGGGSEIWYKHPYIDQLFQYVNSRTAKCLDVPDGTVNATYVWQFHCTGGSNGAQAFVFPS